MDTKTRRAALRAARKDATFYGLKAWALLVAHIAAADRRGQAALAEQLCDHARTYAIWAARAAHQAEAIAAFLKAR